MFTLDNLTKLNQVPLDMTLEGLKAVGQGQQADTIGLQELMREQQFNQQADPFKFQKLQTDANISLQDLQQKTRDNREGDFTSYARMQGNLKKHLEVASSADVKMAYNKFRMMAADPDPNKRALGIAGLQTTEDFLKELEHTRRTLTQTGMHTASAERIAKMKTDALERNAQLAASVRRSLQQGIDPKKVVGELTQRLLQTTDPDDRAALQEQLNFASAVAERLQPAPAPQVDPAIAPGALRDPRTEPRPVAPGINPPPKPQHTLAEVQKMYPGVPVEQLKQLYKQKFNQELQ